MAKKHPVFHYENCVSCGICAQACPVSSITMNESRRQGKYIKPCPHLIPEECIGCGICAKACPMDAIEMAETGESA